MAIDNIQDGSLGSVVRGILNQAINWINQNPKEYNGLVTQELLNPPIVTVLGRNTIGNIAWTYDRTGQYIGTLSGAFPENKVQIFFGNKDGSWSQFGGARATNNTIVITSIDDSTGAGADSLFYLTSIKILVYS